MTHLIEEITSQIVEKMEQKNLVFESFSQEQKDALQKIEVFNNKDFIYRILLANIHGYNEVLECFGDEMSVTKLNRIVKLILHEMDIDELRETTFKSVKRISRYC